MKTLLPVLLVACTGPLSGNYTFTTTSSESDCPDSYEGGMEDPDGEQGITVESATEVTLEGSPDESCDLDGMEFACHFEDIDATLDYNDQGMDAVYLVDAEMAGEWLTQTTLEGTMSVATSCDGADCAMLAEAGAPSCTMSWEFTGEL